MSYCSKILQRLGIQDSALEHHLPEIVARLDTAAQSLTRRTGHALSQHKFYGINQCLHLAGSLVLLESNAQALRALLEELATEPKDHGAKLAPQSDATTFLSVAMLCYILVTFLPKHGGLDDSHAQHIWRALHSVNWIVGTPDMKLLEIPTDSEPPPSLTPNPVTEPPPGLQAPSTPTTPPGPPSPPTTPAEPQSPSSPTTHRR